VFKYSFSCFKLAKLLGIKYTVDDTDYFWSSKKITEFKNVVNRKYCILLMHSYDGKVWWCQFGLTAIKKKPKTNTLNDIKLNHLFFSKYTCFLLLGMFQFNIWMWEMSWENEFKNNTAIEDK
jgi:hypothetical protein